ncbi:MAG: UbiX family flavin prenyltransferase [Bacillota bacterium]
MATYIVAITGASGSVYGKRLLEVLLDKKHQVNLIITEAGLQVVRQELGWELAGLTAEETVRQIGVYLGNTEYARLLRYYANQDIAAVIASGSVPCNGMVVIPCTMSTLSGIAHGTAGNLTERAADIMLKERRPLLLVPRETPLNQIHLENMLNLARMGVHIVPAMPAFYHCPESVAELVDFMVGRVLDLLGVENDLFRRWEGL